MRISGPIIGLVIALVGAAILFDNLDSSSNNNIPGDYWPVLLIVLGAWGWLGHGFRPGFGSVLLMTLGAIFLAQNLVDDTSIGDLWPILAIALGVSIVLGPKRGWSGRRGWKGGREKGAWVGGTGNWGRRGRSRHDASELFSEREQQVEGEYTGSTASVTLGGGVLDLRNATLPDEGATLVADVKLGEYTVRVPADWQLDVKA
ncbi:MAG: hypothetical protein QF357_06065, partial [Dehalococcoidia bacterium]|nr:hypothetical protein [Dehalococcoidia bacterium]